MLSRRSFLLAAAVSLVCAAVQSQADVQGSLRLQDGPSQYQGRVEIFLDGDWHTICDDTWDIADAHVVCRQLGFGYGVAAPLRNFFPFSVGVIWKVNVNCTGNEARLIDCHAPSTQPEVECFHYEDVGVVCSGQTLTNGALRLVGGGHSISEGFLEMYYDMQWGNICSDEWDSLDTAVACSQLGFTDDSVVSFSASSNLASVQPVHSSNVQCTGTENSIFTCVQDSIGSNTCNHTNDVKVACGSAVGVLKASCAVLLLAAFAVLLVE